MINKKAVPFFIVTIVKAEERVTALEQLGFKMIDEKLLGHDNIEYIDYWVLTQ